MPEQKNSGSKSGQPSESKETTDQSTTGKPTAAELFSRRLLPADDPIFKRGSLVGEVRSRRSLRKGGAKKPSKPGQQSSRPGETSQPAEETES